MRPTLNEYFLKIAEVVSTRSTCLHRKVGAVLIKDNYIISTGYNGAPSGEDHCEVTGCTKPISGKNFEDCRAVHAEANAILQAAKHGISTEGSVMYCTLEPCKICSKLIKNAGIVKVIYQDKYYDR